MKLSEYKEALAAVGRDAGGCYSGWKLWDDLMQLLESLAMPSAEKQALQARAKAHVAKSRKRPLTPPEFLERAMLKFAFASACLDDDGAPAACDLLTSLSDLGPRSAMTLTVQAYTPLSLLLVVRVSATSVCPCPAGVCLDQKSPGRLQLHHLRCS